MRHSKPTHRGGHDARASSPVGPSQRMLRAGELIRHALAEILREEDIQDPALTGVSVTVTEVRMSADLKHATCFVEPLGGGQADAVVAGLNRASKFLRGRLGRHVELKFTPQLHFRHDESFAAAAHMNALFAKPEVARDLQSSPSLDGEGDPEGVEGSRDSAKDGAPPSGLSTDPLPGFAGTPPSDDGGDR